MSDPLAGTNIASNGSRHEAELLRTLVADGPRECARRQ